jgi:hypothetical protein
LSPSPKTCWVITEGIAGTENQCIGIAEALGIVPVIKRVHLKFPWKQLSPWLGGVSLTPDSDSIEAPYPDIIIAGGRKSIGVGLHIKKINGDKTFLVQVLDPKISATHFDLVVVPEHDGLRGDNVLTVKGALHRVTPEKIAIEQAKFFDVLNGLPHPRVAVLIGGSSKAHTMTAANTADLAQKLLSLKAGLMITASRRSGEENIKTLRSALDQPNIFFWDGSGDNPYFALLGMADYIIVTEDSVSMTTEALSTGKPVYIFPLDGGAKRLDSFHQNLQNQGYTRIFDGALEQWSYPPLNDTLKVAHEIESRMKKHV